MNVPIKYLPHILTKKDRAKHNSTPYNCMGRVNKRAKDL